MDGLKVSELAQRSGVPATTVRFYDAEGLLPARRSSSGYRLYDHTAVERLGFIGAAKALGLPLPEIRRLLAPWERGVCSDVRRELEPLLAQRLRETGERIVELRAFAARLDRAREQLAVLDREGPCDESCASLGRDAPPVALPYTAATASDHDPAVACTLGTTAQVERAARWEAVLADVSGREAIDDGVRLHFRAARTSVGELAELAAAEADCCRFFDLSLHLGPPPTLDVRAPRDALVLVHELFGEPDA